ncbi:MAG: hypothetical protein KF767_13470 [Bdellovibrionaceae bacterium]|nr:hypothetical protein [Pseudobdellovibrionaceae bacterium]
MRKPCLNTSIAEFFGLVFLVVGFSLPASANELFATENSLNLQSESFLSSDYSSTPDRNYFFFGASFISKKQSSDSNSDDGGDAPAYIGVDVRGRFSPQAPVLSSFDLRELYFRQANFAVGRRKVNWSQGDEDWELGLFQPQYRWNVLRPQSQGLSGAFLTLGQPAGRGWSFELMGTPIFIPDQGAGYVLQEGRFQRVSPWFQNLPREIRLQGSDLVRTLDYNIEIPQLERIVFNSGYSLRLAFDDHAHPSQFSVSLGYKPMNTLSLGIDGWAEAGSRAPVRIEPTVMYHKLASVDYAFRTNPETLRGFEFRAGALVEESELPREQKADLTYATYRPMVVGTTSLGYRNRGLAARVGYIRRSGGETQMVGPKAEELKDVALSRIPYREALSAELGITPYRRGVRSLELRTRWTEGLSETYSRWTLDANWAIDQSWGVWADLVLVRAEKATGRNPDLFTAFENHDSLRAGVSYAF